jgi:hypothetical protein
MTTPTTFSSIESPALPRGRLMFALDATASRVPAWTNLQAKMFPEAAPIGHLDVQLVYYWADECCASKWESSGEQLAQPMDPIECEAGCTQIGRVLAHALRETEKAPVQALVFIGDAMEEQIEELAVLAGKLGRLHVPLLMFQEGRDPNVRKAFRLLALKCGEAYFEFNADAPRAIEQLSGRLNAIARLAVASSGCARGRRGWATSAKSGLAARLATEHAVRIAAVASSYADSP